MRVRSWRCCVPDARWLGPELAIVLASRRCSAAWAVGHAFEFRHLGVHACLFHDQRVAGGECLHLAVAEGRFADVVHAGGQARVSPRVTWAMKAGLAFDRSPHEDIEAGLGDVAEHRHVVVEIPLAENPTFSLFDVGRPPRAVEMMERDRSGLDVGSDPHLLGRSDRARPPRPIGTGRTVRPSPGRSSRRA